MTRGPIDYAWGLGEVIRGYRKYIGLSRPAMAIQLGVAFRSYERMEDGKAACPPGFLTTLQDLADEFDAAVEALIKSTDASPDVHPGERSEWDRAVAGRAAVESDSVVPHLVQL